MPRRQKTAALPGPFDCRAPGFFGRGPLVPGCPRFTTTPIDQIPYDEQDRYAPTADQIDAMNRRIRRRLSRRHRSLDDMVQLVALTFQFGLRPPYDVARLCDEVHAWVHEHHGACAIGPAWPGDEDDRSATCRIEQAIRALRPNLSDRTAHPPRTG